MKSPLFSHRQQIHDRQDFIEQILVASNSKLTKRFEGKILAAIRWVWRDML